MNLPFIRQSIKGNGVRTFFFHSPEYTAAVDTDGLCDGGEPVLYDDLLIQYIDQILFIVCRELILQCHR